MTSTNLTQIGETVTVNIPDPDRNISRSKMQKRGLKPGNVRVVESTDPTQKGGYQFAGEWIDAGENEIAVGAVVLEQDPERDWNAYMILPDASRLPLVDGWTSGQAIVSLRKTVEAAIADPAAYLRSALDAATTELDSARAEIADLEAEDAPDWKLNIPRQNVAALEKRVARLEPVVAFLAADAPAPVPLADRVRALLEGAPETITDDFVASVIAEVQAG